MKIIHYGTHLMKRISIMYDKIVMLFVVWHCWHNVSSTIGTLHGKVEVK